MAKKKTSDARTAAVLSASEGYTVLARRYRPFLVNTVVGFIGPEYLYDARQITRAGLEDHFMGKLHGISMGCDAWKRCANAVPSAKRTSSIP